MLRTGIGQMALPGFERFWQWLDGVCAEVTGTLLRVVSSKYNRYMYN